MWKDILLLCSTSTIPSFRTAIHPPVYHA
jgi:hypothetical protein